MTSSSASPFTLPLDSPDAALERVAPVDVDFLSRPLRPASAG